MISRNKRMTPNAHVSQPSGPLLVTCDMHRGDCYSDGYRVTANLLPISAGVCVCATVGGEGGGGSGGGGDGGAHVRRSNKTTFPASAPG